jgi:hypothetical protein
MGVMIGMAWVYPFGPDWHLIGGTLIRWIRDGEKLGSSRGVGLGSF